VASPAMVASIHPSAWRDCPKSLGAARGVALQIVEKARFDPFRPTHDVRINLRSVAQTPFRTVSEGEFSEVRIASPLYGRASYVQIREFVDPAYIRS
jgi:hypothetical protein